MRKKALSELVLQSYREAGLADTVVFLDRLKEFGFRYATQGGLSNGVEDLEIPKEKVTLLEEADKRVQRFQRAYNTGQITFGERYNKVIDAWTHANNDVAEAMVNNMRQSRGGFNPVFMMFDSGSRGSRDQIRQLAGMRGLMAKPQKKLTGGIGEIIESPIKSNFRRGPDRPRVFHLHARRPIAGVHLDELGERTPKVVLGSTGEFSEVDAVVMDVALPPWKFAQIDIVNPFRPGSAEGISFTTTGFSAGDCQINGQPGNLADYLLANNSDTRLPLLADYCGAMINVSIKHIDQEARRVEFYAPVFPGIEYRLAAPLADYLEAFRAALPPAEAEISFSCNCILNFLYSDLSGKRTAHVTGPMTFGEIGYQLLNQTLVYLTISE